MATKNEWQEYFELMNDRKPTIEETTAAQAAGEFEAEVVAEPVATSAQPEVTAQPTAPVQPEVVAEPTTPVQPAVAKKSSVDTEEIKQKLQGFWGWLKDAVKDPHLGTGVGAPKGYGLITLGLNALGFALTIFSVIYAAANRSSAMSALDYGSSMGMSPSANSMLFRLFMYALILGVLIYGGTLVGAFVARRYVLQDTTFDFKRAGDTVGRATAPGLIAWVVALLGGLLAIDTLIGVGVLLATLIFSFASMFVIVTAPNNSKLNRYYGVLLALVVSSVIFFVIISVGGNTIIEDLKSYMIGLLSF